MIGFRLYLNDSLIIDNWGKTTYTRIMREYSVVQAKGYALKIEFRETTARGGCGCSGTTGWRKTGARRSMKPVALRRSAMLRSLLRDCLRENHLTGRFSGCPGISMRLIRAVAATGKPVIVVLVGGSAVTMDDWLDKVDGVVTAWYPGDEGGNAVADVLFGDYNPAGRLPITFPKAVGQVPLVYNHTPTGRLDYYYDLPGEPLFPFGFGLSYTDFTYGDLKFDKQSIDRSDSVHIRFRLKNVGSRAGDEVVQLYIRDVLASVVRPVMELKGFQRVHLQPGETRELSLALLQTCSPC